MNSRIAKLSELFKEFPGIGERQAKRFVYFLLTKHKTYLRELGQHIMDITDDITQCHSCFRYFEKNLNDICDICLNPKTDRGIILVVEKDADLEAIRRSHVYNGSYFIFGGVIPIADTKTMDKVRLRELISRMTHDIQAGILKEVVLAFALNPQGEHTDMHIRQELERAGLLSSIKLSSLGRGLSTGSELEYADKDTLGYALSSRK